LYNSGYAFDDYFPNVIASAISRAIDAGTPIFFEAEWVCIVWLIYYSVTYADGNLFCIGFLC
jgi:hypothetical protein